MIVFKKLKWKNFLSTGSVFTEFNLNTSKTNLIVGTNGAGKSTILDALTFSLFGKPFRKINKPMLVNSINNGNLVTEIEFESNRNQFKIVRGIKPVVFEIWQNGVLIDQNSTSLEYQKYLEQNILKMNYKSFTQIVVLGSSTFVPFMRLPVASRREIIEDILDIQIFSLMNVALKDKVKTISDNVRDYNYQIDLVSEKIEMQKKFLEDLEKKAEEEIDDKKLKIHNFSEEVKSSKELRSCLVKEKEDLTEELKQYKNSDDRLTKLNTLKGKIGQKFVNHKSQHQFFSDNETCPTCGQKIEEHIKQERLDSILESIKELQKGYDEIELAIEDQKKSQKRLFEINKNIDSHNSEISFVDSTIDRIQNTIESIWYEIEAIQSKSKKENEAYTKLKEYELQQDSLKEILTTVKTERECLQAAAMLLKDNGIKTRIIKRYLPVMNKLINEYLQNMDFYVNFTLDENFEETIKSRHRDVFSYESFSEGEKARIDIALLLTWRSIAKLKNSVDTNLLILDEIFDGSLDQNGTSDLGWILRNFDETTNVFVISHKEGMEDKFDSTWKCEKIKNFSYVKETAYEVAQGA